ncbi:MAG: cyanophycinase, partial [Flavobacteriales bacterium]|nr:cyanophycinase [Flavobacteriales bacterium]
MARKKSNSGVLIPIGGAEKKGDVKSELSEFIEQGILTHVVKESGGKDARILVFPTASKIPVEVGQNYLDAFSRLGCTNVEVLDLRLKKQSNEQRTLDLVQEADCLMFSGGNQAHIASKIRGTKLHELIVDRLNNDGLVVAGTSAGAMAMAAEMIAGGKASESFVKGAVHMKRGLGLIPELIIDTHFVRRGRFGRLAEAVAKFPNTLGLGLAEDTGLINRGKNEFTVIGSGMVV